MQHPKAGRNTQYRLHLFGAPGGYVLVKNIISPIWIFYKIGIFDAAHTCVLHSNKKQQVHAQYSKKLKVLLNKCQVIIQRTKEIFISQCECLHLGHTVFGVNRYL